MNEQLQEPFRGILNDFAAQNELTKDFEIALAKVKYRNVDTENHMLYIFLEGFQQGLKRAESIYRD